MTETILRGQLNKRQRLERAHRIVWRGRVGVYSIELWLAAQHARYQWRVYGEPSLIWFDGNEILVGLTEAEELSEACLEAWNEIQKVRSEIG